MGTACVLGQELVGWDLPICFNDKRNLRKRLFLSLVLDMGMEVVEFIVDCLSYESQAQTSLSSYSDVPSCKKNGHLTPCWERGTAFELGASLPAR